MYHRVYTSILYHLRALVFLRAIGGVVSNTLAPKLGPLGLPAKKVAEDIAKETGDWKGLAITVKLIIQNRQWQIELIPSAATLLLKQLKEDPPKSKHDGNLTLEQVYEVARAMRPRSLAKTLVGTVKEMIGTCVSLGCSVNGKPAKEFCMDVKEGRVVLPDE